MHKYVRVRSGSLSRRSLVLVSRIPNTRRSLENLLWGDGLKCTSFSQFAEWCAILVVALPGFVTPSVETKALNGYVLSWLAVLLKLLQNGLNFLSVAFACPHEPHVPALQLRSGLSTPGQVLTSHPVLLPGSSCPRHARIVSISPQPGRRVSQVLVGAAACGYPGPPSSLNPAWSCLVVVWAPRSHRCHHVTSPTDWLGLVLGAHDAGSPRSQLVSTPK